MSGNKPINVDRTRLMYSAFEVAVCIFEEVREQAPEAVSVAEAEAQLRMERGSLGRQAAVNEFRPYPKPDRERAYDLARHLANALLAGDGGEAAS